MKDTYDTKADEVVRYIQSYMPKNENRRDTLKAFHELRCIYDSEKREKRIEIESLETCPHKMCGTEK